LSRELVKNGRYRHYKNKLYRALDIVKHSETLEELVLYEALYENSNGRLWVRPKAMFLEDVIIDGKIVPRFALVSEEIR
jgi:hypothetical protein